MTTLEDRLRAVEDKLAIYHLIASHPPAADTGTDSYYRNAFATDGTIDLGTKTASGNDTIGAVVKTPEHQAAIAGGAISPDCRASSSTATARWRSPTCRCSAPIAKPSRWNCPVTDCRAAIAFTGSAPTAGTSNARPRAGR